MKIADGPLASVKSGNLGQAPPPSVATALMVSFTKLTPEPEGKVMLSSGLEFLHVCFPCCLI